MQRVLVTGASGFIGRHVVEALQSAHWEVHTVSREPAARSPGATHHAADLLDAAALDGLLSSIRPSHCIHSAWYAIPGQYGTSAENLRWVEASLRLGRRFWEYGGQRLVLVGTCAQYDWDFEVCDERNTPAKPRTLYGQCKQAVESVLLSHSAQLGRSLASGRLFLPYGPHDHVDRLLPFVIGKLHRGEPAICSVGTQSRDFLYARDVADALVALLHSDLLGPVNIASGCGATIRDVVARIGEHMGRPDLLRFERALPPDEPKVLIANVARLTHEVGWRPKYTLDQGIVETIHFWRRRFGGADPSLRTGS